MATPFVQGRLQSAFDKNSQLLSIVVKTECAHCGQPLHIEIDREMRRRVEAEGANPWVFIADVGFSKLTEPSIVDVF